MTRHRKKVKFNTYSWLKKKPLKLGTEGNIFNIMSFYNKTDSFYNKTS